MRMTLEIADELLKQVQARARREKTTISTLTEQGLRLLLKEKQDRITNWKWKPVVVHGDGLAGKFKKAGWDRIRDEIYRGRGT
jgi:hypothetical protein